MRWISVNEQLPTFNTVVLVWRDGIGLDIARYCIDRKWYTKDLAQSVTLVTDWSYIKSPNEVKHESRFEQFE